MCSDSTIYTGITNDLQKRIKQHNESKRGAKYTRSRRPVTLIKGFICSDRSEASRLEYKIKQLSREEKLNYQHLKSE